MFQKRLFEILHFYSMSVIHPLSPSPVFKLEGWNFAYMTPQINAKKVVNHILNFCPGVEIGLKNCQHFINDSRLSSYILAFTILKLEIWYFAWAQLEPIPEYYFLYSLL